MRFSDENIDALTMQQLRGREGARVRKIYQSEANRTAVPWKRRDYDTEDFDNSDLINMALSSAHTCLYGIIHAVLVALGCSPGLGFVHTGHVRSFVYDIADLYKAEITIPIAFDVAASNPVDVEAETRHAVRDAVFNGAILSRCADDVRRLLLPADSFESEQSSEINVVQLWDGGNSSVVGGSNYG